MSGFTQMAEAVKKASDESFRSDKLNREAAVAAHWAIRRLEVEDADVLALADEMARAFEVINCNLDYEQSGCDDPCTVCALAKAVKARTAYIEKRGKR